MTDEDFVEERYQPLYVETFMENRTIGQTIEEWTVQEGRHLFASSDIYRPMKVAVAIQGPSNNCFALDMTKVDWHSQFASAVKNTLIAADLAQAGDTLTLTTVRGDGIADLTMHELQQVGVVYPLINGKPANAHPSQLIAAPHIETPATHAVNRDELLAQWSADVCQKGISVIAAQAARAQSAEELDTILFGEETRQAVQAMVEEHGGHLPTFQKVVEVHGDPSLLSALDKKLTDHAAISSDITDKILGTVEGAYQAHVEDITAYFKTQDMKRSSSSSSPLTASGKRTMFGGASSVAAIGSAMQMANSIESVYPTAMKLHRTVLGKALSDNPQLEQTIGMCVRIGAKVRKRSSSKKNKDKKNKDKKNKEEEKKAAATAKEVDSCMSIGESIFAGEPERLVKSMERRHQLARIPPSPGAELLIGAKSRGGGGGGARLPRASTDSHTFGSTSRTHGRSGGGGRSRGAASAHGNVWGESIRSSMLMEPPALEPISQQQQQQQGRRNANAEPPSLEPISGPVYGSNDYGEPIAPIERKNRSAQQQQQQQQREPPSLESIGSDMPELETVTYTRRVERPAMIPIAGKVDMRAPPRSFLDHHEDDMPPALEKVGVSLGVSFGLGRKGLHLSAHAGGGKKDEKKKTAHAQAPAPAPAPAQIKSNLPSLAGLRTAANNGQRK